MQFGQFAADRGRTRTKACGKIGERRGQTRAAFEQHQSHGNGGERRDAFLSRRLFGRQKALEEKAVGRQAGGSERGQHRRSAGHRNDSEARLDRFAHQFVAGIGNKRRAGIGDQRDRLAFGQAGENFRAGLGRVVLVIRRERCRDAVMLGELAGDAAVLAGDDVGGGENFQSAQTDIAQVSDRRRDQIKRWRRRRGFDSCAGQRIAASASRRFCALWPCRAL